MSLDKSNDLSTLAALHPSQGLELHWREYKNSLRPQGSYFLNLRKATKSPEGARSYVKGDPLNLIDWKAYARTDQLLVREKHDEASVKVRIGIDATRSMIWPEAHLGQAGTNVATKLEIGIRAGLNLAFLHLVQGDMVEIWLHLEGGSLPRLLFQPKSSEVVVSEFETISKNAFSLKSIEEIFRSANFENRKKADLCYWLSDGLGNADYVSFLRTGAKQRSFLQILSSLEVDVSWLDAQTCYFDESTYKKEYQGSFLLQEKNYASSLARWLETLKQKVIKSENGRHFLFTDKTAISEYQALLSASA